MKKILSFILVATTVLALTGCGSGDRGSVNMALSNVSVVDGDDADKVTQTSATFNASGDQLAKSIRGDEAFSTSHNTSLEDETEISLSFEYNGALPINTNDGYAYISETSKMVVSFISYTEVINGTEKQYFLGMPYMYGVESVQSIPDIEIKFDSNSNVFKFTITHDKLVASISDGYSTEIIINSVDIVIGNKNDGDNTSTHESIRYDYWNDDTSDVEVVGKLDSSLEGTIGNYVGGVSLINVDNTFKFLAPPTSMQESFNQYSFLKYDQNSKTIYFDDSHIIGREDRYLPGLDQFKDELNNVISIYNGEKDSDYPVGGEDFMIDKNTSEEKITFNNFFKGTVIITEGDNKVEFSYEYDIETYKLKINGSETFEASENSFKFSNAEDVEIIITGGNISNSTDFLCPGVIIEYTYGTAVYVIGDLVAYNNTIKNTLIPKEEELNEIFGLMMFSLDGEIVKASMHGQVI